MKPFVFAKLCFALLLLFLGTVDSAAQTPAKETRTEALLKEIKSDYQPFQGPGTFIVSFKGKNAAEIDVIIIDGNEFVVLFADVAAGKDVNLTAKEMRKMLEFNMQSDYIKVGISDIGSIRVQTEQKLALVNGAIFQEFLDQVAAGADEIAGIVAPVRKKTAAK